MIDDRQNDMPPALPAESWAPSNPSTHRVRTSTPLAIAVENVADHAALVITPKNQPRITFRDVGDIVALIALANEVLRRFDDPRAFTRESIELLRGVADAYEHDTAGSGDDRAACLHEFADALESMLPPKDGK